MAKIKAGVARADITPKLGTLLVGYPNQRVSDNVLDNLTVTALVLKYESTTSVFLSCSTVVINDEVTLAIRQAVSNSTGIELYDINVCSWQVHSAPSTQRAWGWNEINYEYCDEFLIPGCVAAAKNALEDVRDVTIGVGTVHSDVGCNRRELLEDGTIVLGQNPWGPYDPTMTAIRFMSEGKPYANIIHYGAHPTAIGDTNDITRDWPGIMVDRVESVVGGMTLFLNGAVGDVGPRPTEGITAHVRVDGMREVGYRAALDAISACRNITQFLDMDMEVIKDTIPIPHRPLPDKETALRECGLAEVEREPGLKEANYMYWKGVLSELEKGSPNQIGTYMQTITRIGNIVVVPFPGEPFTEIVMRLRKYSPFPHTLSVSTSNGSIGYIVTQDSLIRGGYEVEVCKACSPYLLVENIDDVLVAENMKLIRRLNFEGAKICAES